MAAGEPKAAAPPQERRRRHRSSSSCSASTLGPMHHTVAVPAVHHHHTSGQPLLPPRITPMSGEVTTSTPITIAPNEASRYAEQLRYSIDGSYPTLLYTGPFTLSLPPAEALGNAAGRRGGGSGGGQEVVVVKAIAVPISLSTDSGFPQGGGAGGAGGVSAVAEATLRVLPGGISWLDPQVPSPSLQLRALDAKLYFDTAASQVPLFLGGGKARVFYQIFTVDLARRGHVPFQPEHATEYGGSPVALHANVARIYAWNVVGTQHSRCAVYDAANASLRLQKASSAAAAAAGFSPYSLHPAIPPPVLCVSCGELEVGFEDPPANSKIAYTLNRTEPTLTDVQPPVSAAYSCATRGGAGAGAGGVASPAETALAADPDGLHTYLYESGKRLHLSLVDAEGLYLTARTFVPVHAHDLPQTAAAASSSSSPTNQHVTGSGGSELVGYRFSTAFHRGFHYQDQMGMTEEPLRFTGGVGGGGGREAMVSRPLFS